MVHNKMIGRRYDGGKSPLGGRPGDLGDYRDALLKHATHSERVRDVLGVRGAESTFDTTTAVEAPGRSAGPDDVIHPQMDLINTEVNEDLERIRYGHGEIVTDFVRREIKRAGYDPSRVHKIKEKFRRKLHNRIVGVAKENLKYRNANEDHDTLCEVLRRGKNTDPLKWITESRQTINCTVADLRRAIGGAAEIAAVLSTTDAEEKVRLCRRVSKYLLKNTRFTCDDEDAKRFVQERTDVHGSLRAWNRGELRLEKPQSSSLHHLLAYDAITASNPERERLYDDCQCVLVENDWGASVPPISGEWRTPYPVMCWEFRISGVRVLAFTDANDDEFTNASLWMVYGKDRHWVIDDFSYEVGHPALPPGRAHRQRYEGDRGRSDDYEFRRVATVVYDCIRAVCIMREAAVAEQHLVREDRGRQDRTAPTGAVRKHPPRDYYVVRLVHAERRAHRQRVAGSAGYSGTRAPQRGHWRAGTWVHFDDQDSGRVQYANDGGFVVSKTWRPWHFAGDPNNIIHKEYRA